MPTVVIAGGSGLIGKALSRALLDRGYAVTVLSRDPEGLARLSKSGSLPKGLRFAGWDIRRQSMDPALLSDADAVIQLAGEGIADQRWTEKRKSEIRESRIRSSELLVRTIQASIRKPAVLVSASAIGWYGPDPAIPNPSPFRETDPPDAGYLGETCRLWEESISTAAPWVRRLVILRTGIVLSREGGALAQWDKSTRLGIAAILGSGRQMVSWIHIGDLCRLYVEALENERWKGIYNAVAPEPVESRSLSLEWAKVRKGRFYIPFPVPAFLLKILLGEMSIEILKSSTVSAEKIRETGFQFAFPSLPAALGALEKPLPMAINRAGD